MIFATLLLTSRLLQSAMAPRPPPVGTPAFNTPSTQTQPPPPPVHVVTCNWKPDPKYETNFLTLREGEEIRPEFLHDVPEGLHYGENEQGQSGWYRAACVKTKFHGNVCQIWVKPRRRYGMIDPARIADIAEMQFWNVEHLRSRSDRRLYVDRDEALENFLFTIEAYKADAVLKNLEANIQDKNGVVKAAEIKSGMARNQPSNMYQQSAQLEQLTQDQQKPERPVFRDCFTESQASTSSTAVMAEHQDEQPVSRDCFTESQASTSITAVINLLAEEPDSDDEPAVWL